MSERFRIIDNGTLVKGGFVDVPDEDFGWSVFDSLENCIVGSDGGEPEDQLLVRDWKWVADALNAVDKARRTAIADRDRRIARLETALHQIIYLADGTGYGLFANIARAALRAPEPEQDK